ncbi:GFA family protein [Aminobacter aminovorans]|uniref:CENP-V/GFA domain-containing protein n=1 Tax=Aminobacter aminovorans TaxID=83263 RepID=A0ABR6H836_AMIAI|nr:GFA family protein [Aminobacter aminovorans]MBB3706664.1 hypothetical protein [Aminobacter aminovorans]
MPQLSEGGGGGVQCAIDVPYRAGDDERAGEDGIFVARVKRGFCAECGTTVLSGRESAGVLAVTSGSLDDPGLFRPTMHIWVSSKQPWLKLDDGLPQFAEAAPA